MNIKEFMKLRINDQLYGNEWKNKAWCNSYVKSLQKLSSTGDKFKYSVRGGGDDTYINEDETINGSANIVSSYGKSSDSTGGETDLKNEIGFTIKDTFLNYNTKSMLFGTHITPYYAKLITEIVKYYNSRNIRGNTELKRSIISYIKRVIDKNGGDINFMKLMKAFNAQTVECLLAYLLIAFQHNRLDLILRTTYTFGRVLPLKYKTEWFDNYRLNAYGNVLNMVMWEKYDKPGIWTISEEPKPIDKSVKLNFGRVIKFLVGSLRAFIILNDLLPGSNNAMTGGSNTNSIVHSGGEDHDMNNFNFDELIDQSVVNENDNNNDEVQELPDFINDETLHNYSIDEEYNYNDYNQVSESINNSVSNEEVTDGSGDCFDNLNEDYENFVSLIKGGKMNNEEVCDMCYEHYPFFFGGAHGCDVFDIPNMGLSINEITKFLQRYPSARVGYILNTATYRSGRGQHWVALELTKGKAKLVCSQNSDFDVFEDGGVLRSSLSKNMYGMEHNDRSIQRDNYACGTYAFVSLMELLRFGDIKKAVDAIGVNMSNLGREIGKASSADKVRETIVGFMNR